MFSGYLVSRSACMKLQILKSLATHSSTSLSFYPFSIPFHLSFILVIWSYGFSSGFLHRCCCLSSPSHLLVTQLKSNNKELQSISDLFPHPSQPQNLLPPILNVAVLTCAPTQFRKMFDELYSPYKKEITLALM